MKRIFTVFFCLMLASSGMAQAVWTVRSVPNTRLESDLIHVSDPDGILSDSCEQLINTALDAIRNQADVFIVALNSIGDADIDVFANELFNYWGIGDIGKDNGVLILLAKEQREIKFETGYGVEETLTDFQCQRIFEHDIKPFFKEGDYQSGLCSGVTQVVEVFGGTVPDGLITTLPSTRGTEGEEDEDVPTPFILLGLLMFILPIASIRSYATSGRYASKISKLSDNSTVVDGVRYIDGNQKAWDGNPWGGVGCLKAMMYGLSIILFVSIGYAIEIFRLGTEGDPNTWLVLLYSLVMYFTWICLRQNGRALKAANKLAQNSIQPQQVYEQANNNKLTKFTRYLAPWIGWIYTSVFKKKIQQSDGCVCVECHKTMKPFSNFRFSPVQLKEQQLHTVKYAPYICEYGHVTIVKTLQSVGRNYSVCPFCKGRTEQEIKTEVIKPADYDHSGLMQVTCRCEFCNTTRTFERMIPRKSVYYGSSSSSYGSSSSRSYHSSSSHRSGGSFGGGRSGGGGHRGSW